MEDETYQIAMDLVLKKTSHYRSPNSKKIIAYCQKFKEMYVDIDKSLIKITEDNSDHHSFVKICDAVFKTGISPGRIIAVFLLIEHYYNYYDDYIVKKPDVCHWLSDYVNKNLADWILSKGGYSFGFTLNIPY